MGKSLVSCFFLRHSVSNCDIADDFEWPLTTPNHLNFYILHRLSYLCIERLETSNLVGLHKLITTSPTL